MRYLTKYLSIILLILLGLINIRMAEVISARSTYQTCSYAPYSSGCHACVESKGYIIVNEDHSSHEYIPFKLHEDTYQLSSELIEAAEQCLSCENFFETSNIENYEEASFECSDSDQTYKPSEYDTFLKEVTQKAGGMLLFFYIHLPILVIALAAILTYIMSGNKTLELGRSTANIILISTLLTSFLLTYLILNEVVNIKYLDWYLAPLSNTPGLVFILLANLILGVALHKPGLRGVVSRREQ